MNKSFLAIGASAAVMLFAGCASTEITDPDNYESNIRQEGNISAEEMIKAAKAATHNAMTNAKFISFLKKYKKEKNDPDAIPILKLDQTINDSDDPDLNTSMITDIINETLINAGKVDVTLAEGRELTQAISKSRKLEIDENFDQTTVAKSGTLQAARLVLRPKVTSNTTNNGSQKVIVTSFTMEMADIHTGLKIWNYSKRLGYKKEKGLTGW